MYRTLSLNDSPPVLLGQHQENYHGGRVLLLLHGPTPSLASGPQPPTWRYLLSPLPFGE